MLFLNLRLGHMSDPVRPCIYTCQETMDQVESWCTLNRLTINIDKTKSMSVHGKGLDVVDIPVITISDKPLQRVGKYEYLGVIMDDKLCMDNHIDHIVKKVQGKLCILRKFRRHITEQTALRIYKCLIMCHFDYGDFVIDSGTKIKIEKLNRLQVRTMRCVVYRLDPAQRLDIEDLYHKYNLETLKNQRQKNLLKIMFNESKKDSNIDIYRPERVLRSRKNVKLNHKFTSGAIGSHKFTSWEHSKAPYTSQWPVLPSPTLVSGLYSRAHRS